MPRIPTEGLKLSAGFGLGFGLVEFKCPESRLRD